MAVCRHLVGWDRPLLHVAADWLVEQFAGGGRLDLRHLTLLMPGRRAARRLLELLVDRAESQGLTVLPARHTTPGLLPEHLYSPTRPHADPLVAQLAWMDVLRRSSPDQLARLCPHRPDDQDLAAWRALADRLYRCHVELAGERLDFSQVVSRVEQELPDFPEAERWQVLADLQRQYRHRLDELGLADRYFDRIQAVQQQQCSAPGPLVCIGVAEMNAALRAMLVQVASGQPVHVLVAAPAELADGFDELGCIRPDFWADRPIDLPEPALQVVEGPEEQALAVLQCLEKLDGRYAADEITIGLADPLLAPVLRQYLQSFNLPVRDAAGLPLARTGPLRLLQAVADFLPRQRFSDFASLVRHPDCSAWIEHHLHQQGNQAVGLEHIDAWLDLMDRYYTDHLHGRLTDPWLGNRQAVKPLRLVWHALHRLLAPLGSPRRLSQWAEPLCTLLAEVYGHRRLLPHRPADRLVLESCRTIRDELNSWSDLPEPLDISCPADQAIALLADRLAEATIAEPTGEGAIELLGPLELALDDAPALLLTSFNEPFLPASLNADPFLPDRLRSALGLVDNRRRYGRDALALSIIRHSRPDLALIAARTDTNGDPLRPSRLLFATDRDRLVQRVRRFYIEPTASPLLDPTCLGVGHTSAFDHDWPPPPDPATFRPILELPVTAFADYLACPYRFYLAHVLGLGRLDDQAEELDPAQFGTLAHKVLADFGRQYHGTPTDAKAIIAFCHQRLEHHFTEQFGRHPPAALALQRERLRLRLIDFAHWQAEHADEWEIIDVERTVKQAPLLIGDQPVRVDGRVFHLRGRIDRIDVHRRNKQVAVYDYKVFEKPDTPEKRHQSAGQWTDLQLPLYRHLLAATPLGMPDRLGYICLTREGCREEVATWKTSDLRSADETAAQVIRDVNAGRYYPPADPPPAYDDFAALCGTGQWFTRPDRTDEED